MSIKETGKTCDGTLTIGQLKEICRENGKSGYSRLNKAELVNLCCDNQGKSGDPFKPSWLPGKYESVDHFGECVKRNGIDGDDPDDRCPEDADELRVTFEDNADPRNHGYGVGNAKKMLVDYPDILKKIEKAYNKHAKIPFIQMYRTMLVPDVDDRKSLQITSTSKMNEKDVDALSGYTDIFLNMVAGPTLDTGDMMEEPWFHLDDHLGKMGVLKVDQIHTGDALFSGGWNDDDTNDDVVEDFNRVMFKTPEFHDELSKIIQDDSIYKDPSFKDNYVVRTTKADDRTVFTELYTIPGRDGDAARTFKEKYCKDHDEYCT